jgi:hypothetical protein
MDLDPDSEPQIQIRIRNPDPLTHLKSGSTTLAKTMRLLSSKLLYGIKMINKHYNSDEKAHPTHSDTSLVHSPPSRTRGL